MTSLALATALQMALVAAAPQDYATAAQRSAELGRPLVVLVGATWCPGCQVMSNRTMPAVAEAGGLEGVEYAYVDADQQPELARQLLRGSSIPQLVRFDRVGDQWQVRHMIGAQSPDEVAAFVDARQGALRLSSFEKPVTPRGR